MRYALSRKLVIALCRAQVLGVLSLTKTQYRHLGRGDPDDARVQDLATKLDKALAGYDTILGRQKYLAGDEISLADLFHLPYGSLIRTLGYKKTFEKYPNVEKWFAELAARETWVKISSGA